MKFQHLLPIFILLGLNAITAHAQPIYVNDDAGGANTGATWEDAFTSLQDALAAAAAGDEIWVAEGICLPAALGGSRSSSFVLDKNLKLYGGFAGTENSLEDREDPVDFPTILSGDLNGDDVENDFQANRGDNAWTVLLINAGISNEAEIDNQF